MIRIQVTCPFTYEYYDGDGNLMKRHYLTAGNYYHLDEVKDKEEIRYVLSPNFIFKNYIYINLDTVPKELIELATAGGPCTQNNVFPLLSYAISEPSCPTDGNGMLVIVGNGTCGSV